MQKKTYSVYTAPISIMNGCSTDVTTDMFLGAWMDRNQWLYADWDYDDDDKTRRWLWTEIMLLNSILTAAAAYYCKMSVNATADDFFRKVKDTIGVEYKDVYQCSGWDFCRGAITIRIRDLYDADIKYNKDARTLRSIVYHINKSLAVPADAILRIIQSEPVEAEPVEAESVAVEPVATAEMIEPVAT